MMLFTLPYSQASSLDNTMYSIVIARILLETGRWEDCSVYPRARISEETVIFDLFFRARVVLAQSSHNPKEEKKEPEFGSLRPLVRSERAGSLGGTHV